MTVDAIVDATARVLVKAGFEGCSTNRVAREAGVSIGSLYQYFPSKEALVLAVMERHNTKMWERIEQRMQELQSSSLRTVAVELVRLALELHRLEPKLRRVLVEQVPRIGPLGKLSELNLRYERLVAMYLEKHREELEVKDVGMAAFVIVSSVESLVHHALTTRSELLAGGALEEQIVRLVLGYLAPSA